MNDMHKGDTVKFKVEREYEHLYPNTIPVVKVDGQKYFIGILGDTVKSSAGDRAYISCGTLYYSIPTDDISLLTQTDVKGGM